MPWYDLVILAILVYGAWQGAARGLVMQLAWIFAIVLCFKFADKLAPQIETHIGFDPPLRHWVAMFILYLGFSLGTFLAARSLSNVVEKAKFRDFDRHLGGLFGLLKGAVLSLVLTFFAVTLSAQLQDTVVRSKTGYAACWTLDQIGPLIPKDAHPKIKESLAKFEKALEEIHDEHAGEEVSTEHALKDLLGERIDNDGPVNDSEDDFRFPRDRTDNDTSTPSSYEALLDVLPETTLSQWRLATLRNQWQRMTVADRERWVQDLKYPTSGAERTRLQNELYGLLSGQEQGEGGSAASVASSRLLQLIVDEYPNYDDVAIRINQHLAGVPERIQLAVLEDWYSDLIGSGLDPDPRTDANTRIDDRILNQLVKARVSVDQLSSYDLKSRLQRSR
ncbi:MAG: CvpA family protein [Planctomycetaceae bacterium]